MLPLACLHFVDLHGRWLLQANLRQNFVFHLLNLWDFGLLNAAQLQGCLKKLDEVATEGGLDEVATEGGLRRWQGR